MQGIEYPAKIYRSDWETPLEVVTLEWLKKRLEAIERVLRRRGVDVNLDGLWKQLNASPELLALLSPHINASLDFIERMVQIHGPRLRSIEVEPRTTPGDTDILMLIGRESYAFQVKARFVIRSMPVINLIATLSENKFLERTLSNYGSFVRVMVDDISGRMRILEQRSVNEVDDYSIAVVFKRVDNATVQYELKQIRDRIRKAARQLAEVPADYRVVVYDARYSPVRTSLLINATQQWLLDDSAYFRRISGIIYMRLGSRRFSHELIPLLIPVSNPRSTRPLNERLYYYRQANYTLWEPHYILALPIHIYFKEVGWNDLLDIRPGFKVFRKGIYMGSISPP